MQLVGKSCENCGQGIVAEIGVSGCRLCDVAFHDACLGQPPACPACGTSLEELKQLERRLRQEEELAALESAEALTPEGKGIRMGVVGGILMMLIAVVWFVAGYAGGVIFYYPPVLFLIGVFAFVKGIATGNVSGR